MCPVPTLHDARWSTVGWVVTSHAPGQPSAGASPADPPPPPWTPPSFQTKVTVVGKTKFAIGKILSGPFWYTNFWVPDSPPFSLLIHPGLPLPYPPPASLCLSLGLRGARTVTEECCVFGSRQHICPDGPSGASISPAKLCEFHLVAQSSARVCKAEADTRRFIADSCRATCIAARELCGISCTEKTTERLHGAPSVAAPPGTLQHKLSLGVTRCALSSTGVLPTQPLLEVFPSAPTRNPWRGW